MPTVWCQKPSKTEGGYNYNGSCLCSFPGPTSELSSLQNLTLAAEIIKVIAFFTKVSRGLFKVTKKLVPSLISSPVCLPSTPLSPQRSSLPHSCGFLPSPLHLPAGQNFCTSGVGCRGLQANSCGVLCVIRGRGHSLAILLSPA